MPAAIFSGTKVKLLKKIADLFGGAQIHSSTTNPTTSAVNAPVGSLLLNETTGDLYRKLDAGSSTNWALVGSEAAGAVNLAVIDSSFKPTKPNNANAEVSVGDWAAYADAAAATPVDMTGGSPNTTIARNTSSPLSGAADFLITVSSGATRQGEGASLLVNVPPAYRGQILTLLIPYKTTGTISDGDFVPYAYDVTNASLIVPTVISGITGAQGRIVCTLVTSTSTASLRVGIHVARAVNTGAVTINFDDVLLAADDSQANVPMSDWVAYTPTFTGFGTVSTSAFFWRRVGDSVEITGKFTSGTTTATEARLSLPNSLVSDSTKVPAIRSPGFWIRGSNTTAHGGSILIESNVGYITFGSQDTFGNVSVNPVTKQNASSFVGSGEEVHIPPFTIPISGWSAGGGTSPVLSLSDWASIDITPSAGFGTISNNSWFYKRVGDSMHLQGFFTTGTVAATTASLALPSGIRIDSAKMGSNHRSIGVGYELFATGSFLNTNVSPVAFYDGSDTATIYLSGASGSNTTFEKTVVSNMQASGGSMVFGPIIFPVAGWTSVSSGTLTAPRSEVHVDTQNGYGSTATKIRRFTNTRKRVGPAISITDDATNSTRFTVNEAGVYAVTYCDFDAAGSSQMGISVNAASVSTDIDATTYANGYRAVTRHDALGGQKSVSWTGNLSVGDVVRAHTDGFSAAGAANSNVSFTIVKVSN